jgi:predicted transcriptional regulator
MNIQTVALNLRNTIAGKEQHLKTLNGDLIAGDYVDRTVTKTTIEFLKINIDELKRILQDVEQCIDEVKEV